MQYFFFAEEGQKYKIEFYTLIRRERLRPVALFKANSSLCVKSNVNNHIVKPGFTQHFLPISLAIAL